MMLELLLQLRWEFMCFANMFMVKCYKGTLPMLSFPIHDVLDISISRVKPGFSIDETKQCVTIKIITTHETLELELYGAYPYPVIAAQENVPIVVLKEEEE
jgi:hypothetical protein